MVKNILKKFVFIIFVICLNVACFAKPFSKDGYYRITNPTSRASIIAKGDGSIIMKSMNEGYEFIDLLNDEKTEEPTLIFKRIEGEEKYKKEYYGHDGALEFVDELPTCRMELYFLDGSSTGFKEENVSYINNLVGDKVIFYREAYNFNDRNAYIYDYKRNVIEKADFQIVEVVSDKKLIVKTTDPYGNDKRKMVICDYDFNVLKEIDGYSYEYFVKKKDKVFLKVFRQDDEGIRYYNLLDDDFNFIFDEDIDANIFTDDNYITTLEGSKRILVYDFENMKVLENTVKNEDMVSREELEKQGYQKFHNGYFYKYEDDKVNVYDENLKLITKINKNYSYIYDSSYNDKLIYVGENGFWDEQNDVYKYHTDIYNADFKLVKEDVGKVSVFSNGMFSIDNVVYDFDFKEVKVFDDNVEIQSHEKDDKVWFEDKYDNNYKERGKFNIYDEKMNIIFENVDDTNFYASEDCYFVVKDNKTMVVDMDNKIIKVFDKPYEFYIFDKKYYTCLNKLNNRYCIINDKFDVITKEYKKIENLNDDYFVFQNGFKYGLMDFNENVLISYSIFDTMDEDSRPNMDLYY